LACLAFAAAAGAGLASEAGVSFAAAACLG
jgi:hypothetical protein